MFSTNIKKLSERILKHNVRFYAYDSNCMEGKKIKLYEPSLGASGEAAIKTKITPIKPIDVVQEIRMMKARQNLPLIKKYYRSADKWIIDRIILYFEALNSMCKENVTKPTFDQKYSSVQHHSSNLTPLVNTDNFFWLFSFLIGVPPLYFYLMQQPQNEIAPDETFSANLTPEVAILT